MSRGWISDLALDSVESERGSISSAATLLSVGVALFKQQMLMGSFIIKFHQDRIYEYEWFEVSHRKGIQIRSGS